MVRTEIVGEPVAKDEIDEYRDLRSVGSSEAAWHIFNFNIAKKHPAVYALRCHLEDEQQVVFDEGNEEEVIEKMRDTELTKFFDYNMKFPDSDVKYVDFPKKFTWDNKNKEWKIRKRCFDTIGRVHSMNPLAGDVFYLRLLLHHDHCKGKTSFEDLMTVEGICHESYQEVCRILGLLQDDKEWEEVLTEGAYTKMSPALRELFVTILMFCNPSNPLELFEKFHVDWSDDFKRDMEQRNIEVNECQLKTLVTLDIKQRLQSWDRDLKTFRIPEPSLEELESVSFNAVSKLPVLVREELMFEVDDMKEISDKRKSMFTDSQRAVFDLAMESVITDIPLHMFIDARGGTGKTFILNAILAAVRCIESDKGGSIALATGTTGKASNLLHLGRTFHSRFKAVLSPHSESVCNIDARSTLADLIRMAKIIIIDEAPMLH